MSASLVGSEMCIRDSSMPQLGLNIPNPSLRTEGADRSEIQSDGRIPVSYTHLTLPTICSV
eukprot:12263188-Alexandrium_andersonii.AAC.1